MSSLPVSASDPRELPERCSRKHKDSTDTAWCADSSGDSADSCTGTGEANADSQGCIELSDEWPSLQMLQPIKGKRAARKRLGSPRKEHSEDAQTLTDSAAHRCRTISSCTDTSMRSTHSPSLDSTPEKVATEFSSSSDDVDIPLFPKSPEKGTQVAMVLRWDAEAGAWVPDEMEIEDPSPLPKFAMAFSNGAEAYPQNNCWIFEERDQDAVTSSTDFFEDAAESDDLHTPGGKSEENKENVSHTTGQSLRPDAKEFFPSSNRNVRSTLNVQAAVFVPSETSGKNTMQFGATELVTTSFRADAPVFVPGQEGRKSTSPLNLDSYDSYDVHGGGETTSVFDASAPVFVPRTTSSTIHGDYDNVFSRTESHHGTDGVRGLTSHRSQLNTYASSYVPLWETAA